MIETIIDNQVPPERPVPAGRRLDLRVLRRYKGWPAVVLCLFVILSLVGTLSARYGSGAGTSPVSRGTVPPSSYGKGLQTQYPAFGDPSGLVRTPNPIDNTSNLVVTGNVSGGRSFRGPVPYGSTTSFGGQLGSTSLDPFLRYSAMPDEQNPRPPGYTAFHSPTATVPRIQPGESAVFAPGSPRIAVGATPSRTEQPADVLSASEPLLPQVSTGRAVSRIDDSLWSSPGLPQSVRQAQGSAALEGTAPSWAKPPDEMRRLVAGELGASWSNRQSPAQTPSLPTSDDYQQQLEQLQRGLDRVQTEASAFEQDLRTGRSPSGSPLTQPPRGTMPSPVSAEALRRIIQPQHPAAPMNPSAGSDVLPNLATLAPEGSPPPGRTQDPTTGGLASVWAGPSTESGLRLYGQGTGPAPSLSEAQKSRIDAIFAPQTDATALNGLSDRNSTRSATQRVEETARAFETPADNLQSSWPDATGGVPPSATFSAQTVPSSGYSPPLRTEPASGADERPTGNLSSRSTAPQGQESVFNNPGAAQPPRADRTAPLPAPVDSVSQEKFDRYMQMAQLHLQQGRHARAAESFALASVYDPRDARPQIGRSHALLAAGDYLGSAVCLAKAIELDPRHTLRKLDLIEAVGGPDQFVQRITDLEQRAKTGDAPPGFQLLLAYIYQQMDRPAEAHAAVQAAKRGLPASKSVTLLEAAIAGVTPG
jgi:hypothetical protein